MAAAAAKNTAEPPGASAVSPNGVWTESSAMDPTTRRLISHPIRGRDPQEAESVGQDLTHRARQQKARSLFGLAQDPVLVIPGVGDAGQAFEVRRNAMGLE